MAEVPVEQYPISNHKTAWLREMLISFVLNAYSLSFPNFLPASVGTYYQVSPSYYSLKLYASDFILKQNRNVRVLLMNQMWAFLCLEKICDAVAKKWMMNEANMGA